MQQVPFCDLAAAHHARGAATETALLRVARSGHYVLGPEVEAFEREFADHCRAVYAVGVGSGTAALALILRAAGIGAGDQVIVPAYTAPATWMAVVLAGAEPVGADVDPDTGLIDPGAVAAAIGDRTRAVVGVHLFGRLAPMAQLRTHADRSGLLLIEDAAHAVGVDEGEGPAGSLGDAAAFSFYPTKTLGCLGDGGAVVTDDARINESVRRLRSYGWSRWHGDARAPGGNSRLDEIQAAVLRERLRELPHEHRRLSELGVLYRVRLERCPGLSLIPRPHGCGEPPWHQFVIAHPRRDGLRAELARAGIGTGIHYDPIPPKLTAFAIADRFPLAIGLAARALSLPFDPWLTDAQALAVCAATESASGSSCRSET